MGDLRISQSSSCSSTAGPCVELQLSLTNDGERAGSEVVQVYVKGEKGPRALRGFKRSKLLSPGSGETISFVLGGRDLGAWYDVESASWQLPSAGAKVAFQVGASSADIRLLAEHVLQ